MTTMTRLVDMSPRVKTRLVVEYRVGIVRCCRAIPRNSRLTPGSSYLYPHPDYHCREEPTWRIIDVRDLEVNR